MASRMSKPLLFSKAPPAGILFEHATRMGNGGIRVAMQYDLAHAPEMDLGTGKQAKVLIQTAKLRRATPVYSEKFKKWTCLCSMGGYQDEFGEIAGFYSWVKDMDTHVIGTCKERCQEWFKKSLTAAQVEDYYTSSIKIDEEDKYPPSLRVNLPFRNGTPEFDVFGPGGASDPSTLEEWKEMSKTSECRLIVEFSSVYFSTKAYGITTAVRAVQFFPKDRLVGFAFGDGDEGGEPKRSEEEEENLRQAITFIGEPPRKKHKVETVAKSDDAEEEEPIAATA